MSPTLHCRNHHSSIKTGKSKILTLENIESKNKLCTNVLSPTHVNRYKLELILSILSRSLSAVRGENILRARTVLSPRYLYYSSLMEGEKILGKVNVVV